MLYFSGFELYSRWVPLNWARCTKRPSIRLGSKLYPSNTLRMLNIDLTRFMPVPYAKIEKVKERLYWQVEVNRFLLSKEWWLLIYRKIPKITPGTYIFQRPFLRGLYSEGLMYGGKSAFQNRLGSLQWEGNLTFLLCYFGGARSKGFAALRNISKLTFFLQDWAREVCRFSVLFGYLTKWELN